MREKAFGNGQLNLRLLTRLAGTPRARAPSVRLSPSHGFVAEFPVSKLDRCRAL